MTMEEQKEENFRVCAHCGKRIEEGYLLDPYEGLTGEWYCSFECAEKDMMPGEAQGYLDDGRMFWTNCE